MTVTACDIALHSRAGTATHFQWHASTVTLLGAGATVGQAKHLHWQFDSLPIQPFSLAWSSHRHT